MEKILIKSAFIINHISPYHLQKKDILIENNKIIAIADEIKDLAVVVSGKNLVAAVGFLDMRCHIPDLGFEHKETLETARKAAMAGGFTQLCVLPNMQPILDTKDSVSYMMRGNKENLVQIHPIAAVSSKAKGETLSEMLNLHQAGAVAFSDGLEPIYNEDILLKSLLYLQKIKALLIQKPENRILSRFGQMHEGEVSTLLGLKGIPTIAETITIQRDLEILRYTGGKIHFSCVSSAEAVGLIRKAKQEGLAVTCDVSALQLCFTEQDLVNFDTNFKVNPPFRNDKDRLALWEGILDGTVDAITSDHQPQDTENKEVEFDLAAFGAISLQTAFPGVFTHKPSADYLENLLEALGNNPRQILGLPLVRIAEKEPIDLVVWDLEQQWTFDSQHNFSKSANSPFLGEQLEVKLLATFYGDYHYLA
ncbi:MAG: dihydroorotase [Thermonemataceae bacterium]|nr:dihydroorotase [Thermonemataceae bacterium]